MLSVKEREHVMRAHRTNKVVWGVLAGSVALYAVAVHFLKGQVEPVRELAPYMNMLRTALMLVSIVTLLLAPVVRKLILRSARDKAVHTGGAVAGAHVRDAVVKYMTAMIVSLALIESVAIYGLVLFIIGDTMATLYAFVIASFVFMVAYYPKADALEKLAMELKRQDSYKG